MEIVEADQVVITQEVAETSCGLEEQAKESTSEEAWVVDEVKPPFLSN